MPQGLQIWDALGNLQVDVTNSITTFIGTYTITKANPKLVLTHPLFVNNTAFFAKKYTTASSFAQQKSNDNVEIQASGTYTLEFKNLPNGAVFDIYIGVY